MRRENLQGEMHLPPESDGPAKGRSARVQDRQVLIPEVEFYHLGGFPHFDTARNTDSSWSATRCDAKNTIFMRRELYDSENGTECAIQGSYRRLSNGEPQ
jgi:hypothetical protein